MSMFLLILCQYIESCTWWEHTVGIITVDTEYGGECVCCVYQASTILSSILALRVSCMCERVCGGYGVLCKWHMHVEMCGVLNVCYMHVYCVCIACVLCRWCGCILWALYVWSVFCLVVVWVICALWAMCAVVGVAWMVSIVFVECVLQCAVVCCVCIVCRWCICPVHVYSAILCPMEPAYSLQDQCTFLPCDAMPLCVPFVSTGHAPWCCLWAYGFACLPHASSVHASMCVPSESL